MRWGEESYTPKPDFSLKKLINKIVDPDAKKETGFNLVQFDFQQKHPGLFKDSPLHRESSTKRLHRGWQNAAPQGVFMLAQGVVMHRTGGSYPSKIQPRPIP